MLYKCNPKGDIDRTDVKSGLGLAISTVRSRYLKSRGKSNARANLLQVE
jgi:hypothetical protein